MRQETTKEIEEKKDQMSEKKNITILFEENDYVQTLKEIKNKLTTSSLDKSNLDKSSN
jgi:hypothetical protein